MKKTLILAAVALALPLVASAGPMKPGKWAVTVETATGPHTINRCVTQEESDKPPQAPKMKDDECKIVNYKVDGNTVTWRVTCPKSGATADAKTVYSANGYTSELHMKRGDKEFTQRSTGKYLGKCD